MERYLPEGWLIDTAKNKKIQQSIDELERAAGNGTILEARAIICDSSHNLIVDLGCMRGMIPREEGAIGISEGKVRDIALISRVNKCVSFKIKEIREQADGKKIAMLSRREVQEECMENYIKKLLPGDIINARVTHFEPFGVFVDIGCGVVSLVPIDAISVSRISHPRDRFYIGQDIKVVIKQVEEEENRVSLSHKELLGTWEENAARFEPGETVAGIVRSIESYGIFVELTPNLAGLAEPREGIEIGQQASVFIKNLIPEKMKVKLIIVDSFDANYMTPPIEYFTSAQRINDWCYSPSVCEKRIETIF